MSTNPLNQTNEPAEHTENEAEASSSLASIIVPMLMAAPVLLVVRQVDDIVPGLHRVVEYLLFVGGAYLVGNLLYFGGRALLGRASGSATRAEPPAPQAIPMWKAGFVVLGISAAGLLIALLFVVAPFILLTRSVGG